MNENFRIVTKYQEDEALRRSYCALSKAVFGLDFEDWYQNGYWKDRYIPHSICLGKEIVANVAANVQDFVWAGKHKRYIQLGTVMTAEPYRGLGFCRRLMELVLEKYRDTDGIFLVANKNVLNFYPKFGFRTCREYQYEKTVAINHSACVQSVRLETAKDRKRFEQIVKESAAFSVFEEKNNPGLVMFYLTKFLQERIYYIEHLNVYAIAECTDGHLFLYQVYAPHPVELDRIIEAFGSAVTNVTLGFAPIETGFAPKLIKGEDTLFVLGKDWDAFEEQKLCIPALSHT